LSREPNSLTITLLLLLLLLCINRRERLIKVVVGGRADGVGQVDDFLMQAKRVR